jgi:hypothetical protein
MKEKEFCEAISEWPEDKQGTGRYVDMETGCYCALGWLMHKNGTPDEVLASVGDALSEAYRAVLDKYEMTPTDAGEVIRINDAYWLDEKKPKQRVQSKFCGAS